jgi:hypothetical protein
MEDYYYDESDWGDESDNLLDENEQNDPLDIFLSNELDEILDLYDDIINRFPYIKLKSTFFVKYLIDIIVYNQYNIITLYDETIFTIQYCMNKYLLKFKKELPITYIKAI